MTHGGRHVDLAGQFPGTFGPVLAILGGMQGQCRQTREEEMKTVIVLSGEKAHRLIYHKALEKQVRQHAYWESPFGDRRYFGAPWGRDLLREVKNVPMQSTAARLMNKWQIKLHEMGAPIVLQMHDEFLLECPENRVSHWAGWVQQVMTDPVPELDGLQFRTKAVAGPNWGSLEPL